MTTIHPRSLLRRPLRVATLVLLTLALTGCVPQMVLNYALRRDVAKDQRRYESALAAYGRRDSTSRRWLDAFRDTTIVSGNDGLRLHAIYREAPRPTTRTALILHGYSANAATMLSMARFYNERLGLNVLLPDFHAHGLSEGHMRQMGWLDRLDMIQWIGVADSLFRYDEAHTRMLVTGVSMGGATTMMVAGEVERQGLDFVRCFVEDCGYTDVWEQFDAVVHGRFTRVLRWSDRRCRRRYGWGFREASARDAVSRTSRPMLFIHGGADTYVPTSMVYDVYAVKPGTKSLWIPEGVAHARSYDRAGSLYRAQVAAFVDKYL